MVSTKWQWLPLIPFGTSEISLLSLYLSLDIPRRNKLWLLPKPKIPLFKIFLLFKKLKFFFFFLSFINFIENEEVLLSNSFCRREKIYIFFLVKKKFCYLSRITIEQTRYWLISSGGGTYVTFTFRPAARDSSLLSSGAQKSRPLRLIVTTGWWGEGKPRPYRVHSLAICHYRVVGERSHSSLQVIKLFLLLKYLCVFCLFTKIFL